MTIATTLEQVGPRLKRIRAQRGVTLTDLSERTGISKSTLSRLENGQRRPSLELLLPLAQAYRVPLDDLVGAPEVGDPRIRLKPRRVKGRTVLPLTRGPGVIEGTHRGFSYTVKMAPGRESLIPGNSGRGHFCRKSGQSAPHIAPGLFWASLSRLFRLWTVDT